MFLPDVNLWLAWAFESHVYHLGARTWFDARLDGEASFCRMTQQGFLRLATNAKAVGADAVSLPDAWRMYDALQLDPRVTFSEEPNGVEPLWRQYTQSEHFSRKVWNDAYLAAFARAANYHLVTFDQGIAKFANLDCTILSSP